MKQMFLSFSVLLMACSLFSACKKEKDTGDDDEDCEISVAAIAGKYKLVAAKYLEGATERDVLHEIYNDCELDDTNELRADKTFIYTDAGDVCSPSGSASGTWNINGRTLILNSGLSNIESFNCTDLVVTYRDPLNNLVKETYRKQ